MWARSLLLIAATAMSMAASSTLTPSRLRCEFLVNPLGIDEAVPRLSWIVTSKERGERQTSYRILVASSPERLKAGTGDLWDSGELKSDDTLNIAYGGKPLTSGQRAWWTVEVRDKDGKLSRRAAPAYWEAGLKPGNWQAKWIGRPQRPKTKIDTTGATWIWFPEGNPAKDAPEGDRIFRKSFSLPAAPKGARIGIAVDDTFSLAINGAQIATGRGWVYFTELDVKNALKPGNNEIVVTAHNGHSRAGLLLVGGIELPSGEIVSIRTDKSWQASKGSETQPAMELAPINGLPYGVTKWVYGAERASYLRKEVSLPKKVARARAYVSARGLYKLYIDGKEISKDIFTPGWTDYKKRIQYQTYDLTSQLQNGKHELMMALGDGWYAGHVGLAGRENYGPKPMGLCQIEIEYEDGSHDRIVTNGSWQAGRGPILTNDLLMGESYDARERPGGWAAPEVQELDNIPLVGQHSETVQKLHEFKTKKLTQPKPGVYVYDLGQNMVGWARLKVQGKAGDKVTLRFAEMLNPDGTIYTTNLRSAKCTDYYTLSGNGEEVYEPTFTFHGFRYVEVTGYPGKPDKDAITGVVVGSAIPQTGMFACSNKMVNQLQHNIFWGQRGNYLEAPTDCPQRDERLGWMGDAQVFARTATFNNDISAFMTKWMQDVADAQSPEGGFSDVSPRIGDMSDGAPAWGDAGVIVPWTLYLTYGDRRLLERHYDAMKAWVDYIDEVNPDHIWVKRSNNNFGDWLNVDDDMPRDVLATAYFARSTDLFARIAATLGRTADAAKYNALLKNIKKAFNDAFVAADGMIKGDTQTCYVLALWFGLVPQEKRAVIAKRLVDDITIARKNHLSTGFVGVGHLCPALTSIGATDVAYKLLTNSDYPSWGYSIKHGATTIWERWDGWTEQKGFQDPGMNSFNHYSLGSVGEWMASTVAGIDLDPDQPAYKHIIIHPRPGGGLTWARATYDSIRGRIESSWRLVDDQIEMTVEIPANTTATVYVPTPDQQGLQIDGRSVSGIPENGALKLMLGSGRYVITARSR